MAEAPMHITQMEYMVFARALDRRMRATREDFLNECKDLARNDLAWKIVAWTTDHSAGATLAQFPKRWMFVKVYADRLTGMTKYKHARAILVALLSCYDKSGHAADPGTSDETAIDGVVMDSSMRAFVEVWRPRILEDMAVLDHWIAHEARFTLQD